MTERPNTTWAQWALEAILVLLLVGAAFAVCALFILQVRSDPFSKELSPATDMGTYDSIAREIVKGHFLAGTGTESPLYPRVFLPLAYLATGGDLFTTRLLQAALQALNVLLIYLIAKRLFTRPTGVAAAVLAVLYVPFIVYSGAILSETLLNTTILLMMLLLLDLKPGLERPSTGLDFLLAGVAIGLAVVAKPTVFLFVPFALLWAVLHAPGGALWRIVRGGICVAGMGIALVPFIAWGYLLTGDLLPVRGNSGAMFLMGNNPTATGAYGEPQGDVRKRYQEECKGKSIAEQDRIAYRIAFEFIRDNPKQALRLLARKLGMFWGPREIGNNLSVTYYRQISFLGYPPFLSFGLILPAAVIGAFLAIPRFRTVWLLYAFVFVYSAAIVAFVVVGRYRLAVVPFLFIFAGHCLARIGRWMANGRGKPAAVTVAIMAFLMVLAYSPYLWQIGYPLMETGLARMGYACQVAAVGPNEFLIKDDAGRLSDYGAMLKPPQAARKTLCIPREILDRAERASIILFCTFSADAQWRLGVNGNFADIPKPEGQAAAVPGTLTIPIKPIALREGENEIVVEPSAGWVKVALDDTYDFNRSAVRDNQGRWRTSRLDTETCKALRSLHIADGEFLIRIRIETKKQTPTE